MSSCARSRAANVSSCYAGIITSTTRKRCSLMSARMFGRKSGWSSLDFRADNSVFQELDDRFLFEDVQIVLTSFYIGLYWQVYMKEPHIFAGTFPRNNGFFSRKPECSSWDIMTILVEVLWGPLVFQSYSLDFFFFGIFLQEIMFCRQDYR